MDELKDRIVLIPLSRYDELIRTETRVNVLVERLWHQPYMSKEDILFILDTELSVELAEETRNAYQKTLEDDMKKYEERKYED